MPRVTPNRIQRVSRRYAPQTIVLAICEDSKSGKRYLEDATRHYRVHVSVEVSHCGYTDPLGIVKDAVSRQKDFEKVFCVIDRDTHANFPEALRLASQHPKIIVIASYPCFEIWYLLHFRYTRRSYAPAGTRSPGQQVVHELRQCESLALYDKGSDSNLFGDLLPRLPEAHRNSVRLLEESVGDGQLNPSTMVHHLISEFELLATPQPANR